MAALHQQRPAQVRCQKHSVFNTCRADRDGSGLVISCSALKRSYRDALRAGLEGLRIVYLRVRQAYLFRVPTSRNALKGDKATIEYRMRQRANHYMPITLLDSQFEALEEPLDEPGVIVVDVNSTPGVNPIDLVKVKRVRRNGEICFKPVAIITLQKALGEQFQGIAMHPAGHASCRFQAQQTCILLELWGALM